MLDNRLKLCAELVSGKGVAVDVGTDHALLAAELINSGKCSKVIASDIKEGPLEAAARTVEKFGLADKIELILSDGIKNVPLDGVTDIVIAGMGGETIADIISVMPAETDAKLILQPMTKPEVLRKKLYEYNYYITGEHIVEDGDKLYIVIEAEPSPEWEQLTETEALYGFFPEDDELAVKYRKREAERLEKISVSLEKAGKINEAVHYKALSYRMLHGTDMIKIQELYDYLDTVFPFRLQEKWDNSGLLVENSMMECSRILLSLDITSCVINEAAEKGAELIISHHPVIFDPLKKIGRKSPVYSLINNDIAAICMHTNVDISAGGTNGVILRKLTENFNISAPPEPFEELGPDANLGWIETLDEKLKVKEFAAKLKEIFGCEYVRVNSRSKYWVSKIAFCSGSGGSMLGLALDKGCDGFITGDVKHDVWIDANNSGIALFDCGHFHTENIVLEDIRRVIEEKYPQVDVEIAEKSVDPCVYI